MLLPDYELSILTAGTYSRVIGIDEVGRGCWAGPVAVGAYIYTPELEIIEGVDDSKVLKAPDRESLHQSLSSHDYAVYYGKLEEINSLGIGKTLHNLIARIVNDHNSPDTLFLIDGQFAHDFGANSRKVVDGDALYYTIAAASILAKVERDHLMTELDKQFSGYGFAQHKGYGTLQHRKALEQLGPCSLHRRSYKPIQKFYEIQ